VRVEVKCFLKTETDEGLQSRYDLITVRVYAYNVYETPPMGQEFIIGGVENKPNLRETFAWLLML